MKFRKTYLPIIAWFCDQKMVGLVEAHGIQAQLIGTGSGHDPFDFWQIHHRLLDWCIHFQRTLQRDTGQFLHDYYGGAFVHERHKFFSDKREKRRRAS